MRPSYRASRSKFHLVDDDNYCGLVHQARNKTDWYSANFQTYEFIRFVGTETLPINLHIGLEYVVRIASRCKKDGVKLSSENKINFAQKCIRLKIDRALSLPEHLIVIVSPIVVYRRFSRLWMPRISGVIWVRWWRAKECADVVPIVKSTSKLYIYFIYV